MSSTKPNYPPGPYTPGELVIPPARPASPATSGFQLHHLMLRIKNPEKSLKFYCDFLGLHVVFIFNAGPWTVYYLGPRDIDITTMGRSRGLLELFHIPADASTPYASGNDYTAPGVGFGHLGFNVPDVPEVLARAESFGYEIMKQTGEAKIEFMGVSPDIVHGKYGPVHEAYVNAFKPLGFVRDPDGYWVEIIPHQLV